MAFTAANVTNLKPTRVGTQKDTVGELFVKSFSFTIPAGSTATTCELTAIKLPADLVLSGVWIKGSLASTANSTLALSTTTGAKTFANAGALTTAWAKRTGANDTEVYTTVEDTVTATIGTATEANAVTVSCTLTGYIVSAATAPYSTFTV